MSPELKAKIQDPAWFGESRTSARDWTGHALCFAIVSPQHPHRHADTNLTPHVSRHPSGYLNNVQPRPPDQRR